MDNINIVRDRFECSSCGACFSICPKNAIEIKQTAIGRKFASANDNCINCGLCKKVCPSLDLLELSKRFQDPYVGDIKSAYVGKSLVKNIFDNAQSGGLCTTVLKYLFDKKIIDAALVTCMEEGEVPVVKSRIITTIEELYKSQKSCYTMVDVLSALQDTTKYNSIAVVGLPCHIHALEALCKTKGSYSNVHFKLGLVCDRILCSTIQDVMLKLADVKEGKVKIEWRRKNTTFHNVFYHYSNAPVVISSGGKIISVLSRNNRLGLKEMFTPPCCRFCVDKLASFADIVFGDPWGISGIDLINGESLVLTRTAKAEDLINSMISSGYTTLNPIEVDKVILGQKIQQKKSITDSEKRVFISEFLYNESFSKEQIIQKAISILEKQKYVRNSLRYRITQYAKRIINKLKKIV